MEQQRNETRQALRRAEQAHAEAQQTLDRKKARRAEVVARSEAVADLVRQHFADDVQQDQLRVQAGKWRVKLASADVFDFVRAVELGSRSVQTLDRLAEMLQELPGIRYGLRSTPTASPSGRGRNGRPIGSCRRRAQPSWRAI